MMALYMETKPRRPMHPLDVSKRARMSSRQIAAIANRIGRLDVSPSTVERQVGDALSVEPYFILKKPRVQSS